jgi:hypothetical protein
VIPADVVGAMGACLPQCGVMPCRRHDTRDAHSASGINISLGNPRRNRQCPAHFRA